jgi:hypothetical protein
MSALDQVINLLAFAGPAAMGQALIARERARGFTVVRPGDVEWLAPEVWTKRTIVAIDGRRIRLVALETRQPGRGALRRLITDIEAEGLIPVVVEPHERLARTLQAWGWKQRHCGSGDDLHTVWHPRSR